MMVIEVLFWYKKAAGGTRIQAELKISEIPDNAQKDLQEQSDWKCFYRRVLAGMERN